jgi:hypothetical protein
VKIRFSKTVDLGELGADPGRIRLVSADDSTSVHMAVAFRESDLQKENLIHALFTPLPDGIYNLEVVYDPDKPPMPYRNITVGPGQDRTAPAIATFYPGDKPQFLQNVRVELILSEPLDTSRLTHQTFMLWANEDRQVPVSFVWRDPFHVLFQPAELAPGTRYSLKVTEFDIVDLAGNLLGDSLTEFRFSILDADSLGSVSGAVKINLADRTKAPVVMNLRQVGSNQVFDLPVTGKDFSSAVPAGKYILSGFIDTDSSGTRGLGGLFPYQNSETMAEYADTISVRARFETAEIIFIFD